MVFAEKICILLLWFPNKRAIHTMYEQHKQNQTNSPLQGLQYCNKIRISHT